jgi:hypothetical protein
VLDVTVVAPEVYVEQGTDGKWLDLVLERREPGWLKVEPDQVMGEGGRVTIVPRNRAGALQDPLVFTEAGGTVRLTENLTQMALDLQGAVSDSSPTLGASSGTTPGSPPGQTASPQVVQGKVQVNAKGAVDLSQLDFALRTTQLPLAPLARWAESQFQSLAKSPRLTQGTLTGNLQGAVVSREVSDLSGTLELAAGAVAVPGLPIPITEVGGKVDLQDDRFHLRNLEATWGVAQGSLTGVVVTNWQNWQQSTVEMKAVLKPLGIRSVLEPLGIGANLPLEGTLKTDFALSGTLQNLAVAGRLGSVEGVTVTLPGRESPLPLEGLSGRFQTQFNPLALAQGPRPALNLSLSELEAIPTVGGRIAGGGEVTIDPQGLFSSDLNLDLSVEQVPADALAAQMGQKFPIAVGTIAAQTQVTGTIANPQVLVALQALETEYPTRARARINGQGWVLEEALVSTAGGALQVRGSQAVTDDRWGLEVQSRAVNFQPLNIPLPGALSGVVELSGPRNRFAIADIRAQGLIQFSKGISIIKDPLQARFGWDGEKLLVQKATAPGFSGRGTIEVNLENLRSPQITNLDLLVQLNQYDFQKLPVRFPQPVNVEAGVNFQGRLTGAVKAPWVQGNVEVVNLTVNQKPFEPSLRGPFRLNPEGVSLRARGQRDFLETRLDTDYLPQSAKVVWNGGVAQVARQEVDRFDVTLNNFPVVALGLELPAPQIDKNPLSLLGTASGAASVSLKPEFSMAGNLAVSQPALGHLQGQELTTAFRFVNGNLAVQDGTLQVGSSQFQFNGRAIVNTPDPSYQLAIAVEQGQVGDFLQVFRWFDLIDLKRGLKKPEYNTPADLLLPNVGLPDAPLRLQLYRFSEVKNQVIQAVRRQQANQKLPPLNELVGDFSGQMSVSGTLKTGLDADFRFEGQEWQWGPDYRANQVTVVGDWKDQRLTLQPVHLTLNDTTEVNFQGILGQNPQFGTLAVTQLPLALVRNFVDLPLDIQGSVNLEANLSGSVNDPQLVGELNLLEGSLNGAELKTENTGFNYSDRRLSFGGTLRVATGGDEAVEVSGEFPAFTSWNLDPVTVTKGTDTNQTDAGRSTATAGTITVTGTTGAVTASATTGASTIVLSDKNVNQLRKGDVLEGAEQQVTVIAVGEDGRNAIVEPALTCDQPCTLSAIPRLRLNLKVADDGIKVLNLLTGNKLTWQGGQGTVNLSLGGTVKNPQAFGSADFSNATIAAQFIPAQEAITDLSGRINFDTDRIIVERLNGRYSDGEVTAQGAIGLDQPLPVEVPPLEVSFRDLQLNIPGKYRGGAAGDVQILGTVLAPRLTGNITANQGKVILPDPSTTVAARLRGEPSAANQALQTIGFSPITLDNLSLRLGDDITIASDPLFNFKATGDLLINGGFEDLRPNGTIKLTRGQVNLFTTNFLLVRGAKNSAVFRPQTGLNPELDIEMVASVTELSRRRPTAGPLIASEISDSGNNNNSFGELQTVRIFATVEGPASEILQNLSLRSRPNRTQGELYALMGGGFVNTLGQGGDSTLALANLAGSALLNNLQAALNSVLRGPVDFRLFPLVVESQNRKDQADSKQTSTQPGAETLALGAEVGVNLTNNVSFSVLRLLTLDIPTRFNVNYQINNNLQLRATSDFQDENRVVLEYEARF